MGAAKLADNTIFGLVSRACCAVARAVLLFVLHQLISLRLTYKELRAKQGKADK
jgi:hypothetical protein